MEINKDLEAGVYILTFEKTRVIAHLKEFKEPDLWYFNWIYTPHRMEMLFEVKNNKEAYRFSDHDSINIREATAIEMTGIIETLYEYQEKYLQIQEHHKSIYKLLD